MKMRHLLHLLVLSLVAWTIRGKDGREDIHSWMDGTDNTTTIVLPNPDRSRVLCIAFSSHEGVSCQATAKQETVMVNWKGSIGDQTAADVYDPESGVRATYNMQVNSANSGDDKKYMTSYVTVSSPEFGAMVSDKLAIEIGSIGSQRFDSIYFEAPGVAKSHLDPDTEVIESTNMNVQPSSVFYTMHTVKSGGEQGEEDLRGPPTKGHLEFVLSDAEIQRSRRFRDREAGGVANDKSDVLNAPRPAHSAGGESGFPGRTTAVAGRTEVCIFAGPKLDGQKQIWVQQSRHMDPAQFHFTWLVHLQAGVPLEAQAESNPVLQMLAALPGITVAANPTFQLELSMIAEDPGDGRGPASLIWRGVLADLYMYAYESLEAAGFDIDKIRPRWCRDLFANMRDTMLAHSCDVVVYGNQGGFGSDVTIVQAARVLGVPTVGELMNLNLHALTTPVAVVAPSTFVIEHESIAAVLAAQASAQSQRNDHASFGVVIPPSVDVSKFDPARYRLDGVGAGGRSPSVYSHPRCSTQWEDQSLAHSPCFVVGFVARLSPEKNPGLFLLAARELLRLHPFARFTVVGNGVLRASLEDLAARLQISWAVHFTGWVGGDDLPGVLAGLDVVVNPGLVLETFCIANIEAMSMAVPLVTFAVGGVGEYVMRPAQDSTDGAPFSVSENAVVVHRVTPDAISEAVRHLIVHPELRRALGQAGRRTVVSHFTVAGQVQLYADLYRRLRATHARS